MFSKGQLFKNSAGSTFRVLGPDEHEPHIVHVFGMEEDKALPQQWKLSDIKDGIRSGEYEKLPFKELRVAIERPKKKDGGEPDKSAAEKAADRRMALIKPLVDDTDIYWRAKRGKLVEERALEMDVSEQTIMTCLRLYWRGGMTRDALLANFPNCGVSQTPANVGAVRGRKTERRKYAKFHMTDKDKANVRTIGLRMWRRKKTATVRAIYTAIVAKHYTFSDAAGVLQPRPLGERPTEAQVSYELQKHITLEGALRRKHGDDKFENDYQPKTGSSRKHADGVGRYFEIDSTIVDVWIVAEDDRATVIGKATLYLVVDTFSNLIVGFHLSLDKPSWSGAMEAMLTVVEDKAKLCERWKFDYQEIDWPAHGVWPMFWVADRGSDFICHASDNAVEGIEGGFVNAPRRKAPRKGRVECGFKLIHVPLKDHLGGYMPPADIGRRQTDDQKDEATRTLKDLGGEILQAIRRHNHRVHKGIKLPGAQVYAGLQPIPVEIWRRDYEERAGMLSSFDEDFVRFKLLPKGEASVTTRGILFNGLLYRPRGRGADELLLRAVRGVFNTPITYERRLVDAIYIHDPKNASKWTTADLTGDSTNYAGMSAAEFESIEGARMTLEDLADEHNLGINVRYHVAAEKREASSKAATKKALTLATGRSRTYGAQEKRAVEVQRGHVQTKVLASTTEAPATSTSASAQKPASKPVTSIAGGSQPSSRPTPTTAPTAANAAFLALLNMKKKS